MHATSEMARPMGAVPRAGVARLLVVGVVGWALAAGFIRWANGEGLFQGAAEIVLFGLALPIAWGTARVLRARGRLSAEQMVPAMGLALIPALFLDGMALTLAPWIYGGPGTGLLPAAAWLLFGVGAFLVAAFLEARRA